MADKEKTLTVLDDMKSRAEFDTKESAIQYIVESAGKFSDFANFDIVSPIDLKRGVQGFGQDNEGNLVFDPEIFPDDMRVMVAVLTQRGEGAGSSSVKCITVSPIPTLEAILADDAGNKWIRKVLSTELNRIAVRILRDKDANVKDETLLDQLPRSLADYVTSNRGGASTLLEAFEEYWKDIKTALGKLSKAWKLQNLSKREFKNAMSSTAYASQYYPTLEETKQGSLFEFAIRAFVQVSEANGKDSTIFKTWLENRSTFTIEDSDESDEDELSFDNLAALLSGDTATESEEPAPVTE